MATAAFERGATKREIPAAWLEILLLSFPLIRAVMDTVTGILGMG